MSESRLADSLRRIIAESNRGDQRFVWDGETPLS
jgi:hypothetical protein